MLVLSRHRNKKIMIGDDIVITVIDFYHGHVRLGIEAPASVPVHREEVFNDIQRERREAANGPDTSPV